MKRFIVYALACLLWTGAAQATGTTYDCKFKDNDPHNWIPPRVVVSMNEANGTAEAYDGLIDHLFEWPISVEFKRRSAKSVQWGWTMDNIPGKGNKTFRASFKVTVNQNTKKATIKILVHGFANNAIGHGNCVIMK